MWPKNTITWNQNSPNFIEICRRRIGRVLSCMPFGVVLLRCFHCWSTSCCLLSCLSTSVLSASVIVPSWLFAALVVHGLSAFACVCCAAVCASDVRTLQLFQNFLTIRICFHLRTRTLTTREPREPRTNPEPRQPDNQYENQVQTLINPRQPWQPGMEPWQPVAFAYPSQTKPLTWHYKLSNSYPQS